MQQDLFPDLNLSVLQAEARGWQHRLENDQGIKSIRRITLHRCIDPKWSGSGKARYVVVFHGLDSPYAHSPETIRIAEGDQSDRMKFMSAVAFDAGASMISSTLMTAYREDPEPRFRDEWDLVAVGQGERLPYWADPVFEQLWPVEEEERSILRCPPGTEWKEIKFTLLSHEMIFVETPAGAGRFTYHELGLSDKRKGDQALAAWTVLGKLCIGHGSASAQDIKATVQKKSEPKDIIRRLNDKLQGLFGIQGERAVTWDRESRGYKSRIFLSNKTHTLKGKGETQETEQSDPMSLDLKDVFSEAQGLAGPSIE
ncbi:MAG: hypothetical protein PVG49_22015 [Desulfobacteraceae bacterium]|jgi:hypothetical protein